MSKSIIINYKYIIFTITPSFTHSSVILQSMTKIIINYKYNIINIINIIIY